MAASKLWSGLNQMKYVERSSGFQRIGGPYIVKNNLIEEATGENIIFFDSDDIMLNLVSEFEKRINRADLVKFGFQHIRNNRLGTTGTGWGVFGIKKKVFKELYFQNWKCNADLEFVDRLFFKGYKIQSIDKICFLRRLHENALTNRADTGMSSDLRKGYMDELEMKRKTNQWDNPTPLKVNYIKL